MSDIYEIARAELFPIREMSDGSHEFAWPGMFRRAIDGMATALGHQAPRYDKGRALPDQLYDGAMDTAGLASAGTLPFGTPRGALRAGVSRETAGLDMSHEARMQRARDMGFDTSQVWYHGSPNRFDEFDPSMSDDVGIYFTRNKYLAANYAGPEGELKEVVLRVRNPYEVGGVEADSLGGGVFFDKNGNALPFRSNDEIAAYARSRGHDAMRWPDGNFTESDDTIALFDPSNIRSVDAAFDPAKSDSSNLAASNPSTANIVTQMEREQRRRRIGALYSQGMIY